MKNTIERNYKEYVRTKDLYNKLVSEVPAKEKELAEECVGLPYLEVIEKRFDKLSHLDLLGVDVRDLKIRLYYTYILYKDLIEIPVELENGILEELSGMNLSLNYDTTSGELVVVDADKISKIRENYILSAKKMERKDE